MTFLAPTRLWLLLLVLALVVAYLVLQGRRKRYAMRFTNLSLLNQVAPRRPGWRRHVSAVLLLVTLVLLVSGFARPATKVKVPRERATIMVALDVSGSMAAGDVPPSRFEAERSAAKKFVQDLPERFNVGLVSFSHVTSVVSSPTKDHPAVVTSIDGLKAEGGTAIADAIFTCLQSIRGFDARARTDPPPARIVLLSDGEDQDSRRTVEDAVQAARQAKVQVFTIAFGTPYGTITQTPSPGARPVTQPVRVDRQSLRDLAESTGGQAYDAESLQELSNVYRDIGSSLGHRWTNREITTRFVGWALLFALGAAGVGIWWSPRIP
ncbi:MAG: VWA domain-containing protein [Streptosporangiales bacterium]|nr:VWA domain-containing protein [Streptosporangiales bacterium]